MPAPVFKKMEVYVCPDCGGEFKQETGQAPASCPLHSMVTCKKCGKTLVHRGAPPKDSSVEMCPDCVADKLKNSKYKEIPFRPDTDEPPTSSSSHPAPGAPVRSEKEMDNSKDPPKEHKPFPRGERP